MNLPVNGFNLILDSVRNIDNCLQMQMFFVCIYFANAYQLFANAYILVAPLASAKIVSYYRSITRIFLAEVIWSRGTKIGLL